MNQRQRNWVFRCLIPCILLGGVYFCFTKWKYRQGFPGMNELSAVSLYSPLELPRIEADLLRLSYREYMPYIEIIPTKKGDAPSYRFQDNTYDFDGLSAALHHWKTNIEEFLLEVASLNLLVDQTTPMEEIHRIKILASKLACFRIKY
ncbi:MAG: hypothetical protein AAFV80_22545, partial [Bacteroidota bacterium]